MLKFIIEMIALTQVSAAEVKWFDHYIKEDHEYKYYVCFAEELNSEEKALSRATVDCYQNAISDNFGLKFQINSNSIETDSASQLVVEQKLASENIQLKNFEKINQSVQRENNLIKVYLHYRYKKSEISKEQKRLDELAQSNLALVDSTNTSSITGDINYNTYFELVTHPKNAEVKVDGVTVGLSNIVVKNYLSPGKHHISLYKEGYEDFYIQLYIVENKKNRYDFKLTQKKYEVRIKTEPEKASVFINDVLLNSLKTYSYEKGAKLNIRVAKKDCHETSIHNYVVKAEDKNEIDVRLNCKNIQTPIEKNIVEEKPILVIEPSISENLRIIDLFAEYKVEVGFGLGMTNDKIYTPKGSLEFQNFGSNIFYLKVKDVYLKILNSKFDILSYKEELAPAQMTSGYIKHSHIGVFDEDLGFGVSYVSTVYSLTRPLTLKLSDAGVIQSETSNQMVFSSLSIDFFKYFENSRFQLQTNVQMGIGSFTGTSVKISNTSLNLNLIYALGGLK